jgi:hypothetical protein
METRVEETLEYIYRRKDRLEARERKRMEE